MGAYDKAAMRDAKFNKYAKISEIKQKIENVKSTIDELVQMQIDMVEDGYTKIASDIGKHIIQLRGELQEYSIQISSIR